MVRGGYPTRAPSTQIKAAGLPQNGYLLVVNNSPFGQEVCHGNNVLSRQP